MKQALAFSGGKDSMACLHLLREELACAIYVDTGFTYPETRELVNYAAGLLPLYVVQTDRQAQNARYGLPSDLVPINWTLLGQQVTAPKAVTIQSYLQCCYENLAAPLLAKAKELNVTHLVFGQRRDETYRGPAKHGDVVEGIVRLHPIEAWTAQQVLDYLITKMDIPPHYRFTAQTSLDCFDCTGYAGESGERLAWTKRLYPERYKAYEARNTLLIQTLRTAMQETALGHEATR